MPGSLPFNDSAPHFAGATLPFAVQALATPGPIARSTEPEGALTGYQRRHRVINTTTRELVGQPTLDPNRGYQPRHKAMNPNLRRGFGFRPCTCPDTSHGAPAGIEPATFRL